MKVLFITPKIPYPPVDGHKKSMWGVVKYLSILGYDIDIVCYRQNENPDIYKNEIDKYAKLYILDVQTSNSIFGAVKNIFSSVPYNLSKYIHTELMDFLDIYLGHEKPNLIHVVNSHMGWIVDFIKQRTDIPVVLRQENLELIIMKRFYKSQKNIILKIFAYLQYKKFLKYEPRLCAKFDLCFMMSREDEKRLIELNPKVKTKVIPLGVEKELLSVEKKQSVPFSLTHIGSLKWYPNLDGFDWFIKEVFPIVIKNIPQTKLYVYGGGIPDNYKLPEGVKNNIELKGYVDDLWDELKDKSLAVVPLRIGSGIRVKILEMMASGISIISTSLGKEGLDIEDGREIFVADSAGEFAEKIINLFNNNLKLLETGESGRNFIRENYLWEKIAGEFDHSYQEILNSKKIK